MKKSLTGKASLINIVCAVLLILLLVLQFTPFWHYGDEEPQSASIQEFVWFPSDNKALSTYIEDQLGVDFAVDEMVVMPVVVLVSGLAGAIVCILKSRASAAAILPAIAGLSGVIGYLSTPALQLGSLWILHLAVCVVLLVLSLVLLISWIATGFQDLTGNTAPAK